MNVKMAIQRLEACSRARRNMYAPKWYAAELEKAKQGLNSCGEHSTSSWNRTMAHDDQAQEGKVNTCSKDEDGGIRVTRSYRCYLKSIEQASTEEQEVSEENVMEDED